MVREYSRPPEPSTVGRMYLGDNLVAQPFSSTPFVPDRCVEGILTGGGQNEGICYGTFGSQRQQQRAIVKYMMKEIFKTEIANLDYLRRVCETDWTADCRHVIKHLGVVPHPINPVRLTGLVLPFLNGGNLKEGRLIPHVRKNIWKYIEQSLRGIRFMHRHGLIHCDIKPQNIMLHDDGTGTFATVIDFSSSLKRGEPIFSGTGGFMLYGADDEAREEQDLFALVMTAYVFLDPEITDIHRTTLRSEWAATMDDQIRLKFPEVIDVESYFAGTLDPPFRLNLADYNPKWPQINNPSSERPVFQ